MREILFRGKQLKDGKWVEGYYCPKPYSHFPCEPTVFPFETINKDWHGERVIPETVGQYTGLKDKNGRKIFEGDIINYKGALAKVIYSTENAGFYALFSSWDTDLRALSAGKYVSVIGNIYDNPELLKGGNENG